jgi:hypothetical protein
MNKDILYIGGAAVLGYVLLSKTTATPAATAAATTGSSLAVTGAPAAPAVYDPNYYLTYQYPAMLAANPNIGNPNYQLTSADAAQYLANYLELQQWLPTVVPSSRFSSQLQALQWHWTTWGVPSKWTFLPLVPPKRDAYVAAPVNSNAVPVAGSSAKVTVNPTAAAASSGGNWVSAALPVVTTLIGLLGPGDNQLNNDDVAVLFNGGGVIKEMLPLFYNDSRSFLIEDKLNMLLAQYSQ